MTDKRIEQRGLYFEEFEEGAVYLHRPGRTVTEADNVLFTTPVSYTHLDVYKRQGIRSVAVYRDADAGARHVALADVAKRIGPAPAAQSYLRIQAVIGAAMCLRDRRDAEREVVAALPAVLFTKRQPEDCLLYTSRCV